MNYHFLIVVLLMTLVPQNQEWPSEFDQIPEHVREKATIVVSGTYAQGRSPCIFRPDGSRVWALESRFQITKVHRGKLGGKTIYINSAMLPKTKEVQEKLEVGRGYLILLRPNEESMKLIRAGEYVSVWNAMRGEEILAILELRSGPTSHSN